MPEPRVIRANGNVCFNQNGRAPESDSSIPYLLQVLPPRCSDAQLSCKRAKGERRKADCQPQSQDRYTHASMSPPAMAHAITSHRRGHRLAGCQRKR